MIRRWLGLFAMIALVAAHGGVRAQEAPERAGPALNWTRQPGAESCIGSVELAGRIEQRVKRKIFVPASAAIVAVEGYVAPSASGGFRASIAMSDGQGLLYGSRELETRGACSELNDGLVFIIAVTLRPEAGSVTGIELPENVASALDAMFGTEPTDPDPSTFPAAPASEPPAAREATPAPAPDPLPVAQPEPPTVVSKGAERVRAHIEALGALQLGLQPSLGMGGGAGLRFEVPGAGSFSVHGALFAESTRAIEDGDKRGNAAFTARMLSLGYCTPALLAGSVLALEACGAGRVGDVTADASAFDSQNRERGSLFVSFGLAARLAIDLNDNVLLALAAGPELHLARPVFEYATGTDDAPRSVELFKASPVGGAAELSVAFALF